MPVYLDLSLSNILASVANIEMQVYDDGTQTQVNVAYINPPYSINVADMPLFVNVVGPMTGSEEIGSDESAREKVETRNIYLDFYHSPYSSGVEGEKYYLLSHFFDDIYNTIEQFPHLLSIYGVIDSQIIADTGATVIEFMGQKYFGIRFTLQVTYRVRRPLNQLE
jgi:hypothetical protein